MLNLFQKKNPLSFGYLLQTDFTEKLSCKFFHGLILVEVSIHNCNYTFMLDTGAMSVIPTSLLEKLPLKPYEESIEIIDADGNFQENQLYTLPSLKINSLEFRDFSVICDDFSQSFPLSCYGFDGILGYNFLQKCMLSIDYKNQKIILSDKLPKHNSYIKTKLRFNKNHAPEFQLTFSKKTLWLGLDTGKNDGIMICDKKLIEYFTQEGYTRKRTVGVFSSSFNGLNQHSFIDRYLVKDFSIDKKIVIGSFIFTTQEDSLNTIGNEFLKYFNIIIDFKHKHIYFEKYSAETIEQEFQNNFGFSTFWNPEKKLYISAITQESPAYQSKLKLGDTILSLNELNTLNMTQKEYCKLKLKLTQKLEIIVKRKGKIIRAHLQLHKRNYTNT